MLKVEVLYVCLEYVSSSGWRDVWLDGCQLCVYLDV